MVIPKFIIRDFQVETDSSESLVEQCMKEVDYMSLIYQYKFEKRYGYVYHIINESEVYDACIFIESQHVIAGQGFAAMFNKEILDKIEKVYMTNKWKYFDVIKSFLLRDPNRWVYAYKYNNFINGVFYSKDDQGGGIVSEVLDQLTQVMRPVK
jgi:hypothetical protein